MRLSSRYNPSSGIADFWHEIRRPTPYRWPVLIASLLSTAGLLYFIVRESVLVPPERPKVSFISTFEAGRTDAEIIASNLANQQAKERRAAEQAERDEAVKDAYRALGRASGMDVAAMERRIAADKAAEAARIAAARRQGNRSGTPSPGASVAPPAR